MCAPDFSLVEHLKYTQFYRIKGGGGSGRAPTDNFLIVNFTPANYISLEREFNSE